MFVMSYKNFSTVVSILFFALFVTLVALPEIVYWLFGLQGNELGDFFAKRAGMLFFGLTILCFYSRNTKSKEAENLVALSVGAAMAIMALLGVYEFAWGNAGLGILLAVIIEVLIAVGFSRFWINNR